MADFIILILGAVTEALVFTPLGIGMCAHRYAQAGIPLNTQDGFIHWLSSSPRSYTSTGKLVFTCLMLTWLCIFFGAWYLPILGARILDLPTDSPIIEESFYLAFGSGVIFFFCGYRFWRRQAYSS
jgi:hypothetical protein